MPRKPTSVSPVATPSGCTHFRLRQLMRRVSQAYDGELARAGLKTTQYSLLSAVLRLGPVRPVDLALAIHMDASTLTRNLKPLLLTGWVALGPGEDGRSRLVTITPSGRSKRAEAQRHWHKAQLALNEALGAEQVVALHSLIDQALGRLDETHEGDGDA